ncbi:hypothetical protein AAG906_020448 [Vitis piasezkii]
MILASMVKDKRTELVWSLFREMSDKGICPNMEENGFVPTIVTYNTLLNWSAKAYLLLKKMRKEMISPNEVTYNTLINGFVKEGKIGVAAQVFNEMSKFDLSPNCVTYNALIGGHCHVGDFEEALRLLDHMEAAGLRLNEVTYGTLLNGLCKHEKFELAKRLLERMRVNDMVVGHIAYTVLIDGLCKNGMLDEAVQVGNIKSAKEIICRMYRSGLVLNKIIYSTLIYNFCQHGNVTEAMKVYAVMNCNGHGADHFTCNVLVSSLCRDGNIGDPLNAFSFFDNMIKCGQHPSFFTYGSLLKGLCKGGNLVEAKKFLNRLHYIPGAVDSVMYNTLLAETCKSGNLHEAVALFDKMVQNNVLPDSYTYSSLLTGLCRKGKAVTAVCLFGTAMGRGTLFPNHVMYTCLVDGLSKAGHPKAAFYFFEEMMKKGTCPDTVAFNAIIDSCSRRGQMMKANDFFSTMRCTMMREGIFPDKLTFHSLILGLSKSGIPDLGVKLLGKMIMEGTLADQFTFNILINKVGDIQGAFKLKDEMEALGFGSHEVAESAMVRGLLHCGKTEDAMLVLDHMLRMRLLPTIATFTTLMHRFCRDAKIAEALKLKGVMELCAAFELYEEMRHRDLCPNITTYAVLVDAISAENNLIQGEKLLTDLQERGLISWGGSTQHLDKELTVAMGKLNYIRCFHPTTTEWTITTVTPWCSIMQVRPGSSGKGMGGIRHPDGHLHSTLIPDLCDIDFLQWVDLSNDFNSCFGNHMMLRQDLQVQNDLLQSDPHFQDAVLHMIYVIRTTMFRSRIQEKRVPPDLEDKVLWTVLKNEKFSVKSLYDALEPDDAVPFLRSIIWSLFIQSINWKVLPMRCFCDFKQAVINELVIFFYAEPKLINELVPLLTYEGAVPDEIQILSVTVGCFLSRLILSGICIVFTVAFAFDQHCWTQKLLNYIILVAALFRDLEDLDDAISCLKVEVSH